MSIVSTFVILFLYRPHLAAHITRLFAMGHILESLCPWCSIVQPCPDLRLTRVERLDAMGQTACSCTSKRLARLTFSPERALAFDVFCAETDSN